ncbi:17262_t:CDS:2 [Acaulospora morrowiae]|uniref:Required for respiratory growth protein 9, mitochondrial n=1 Tax=Acaulospora morrowiae TaxID=94023 RepID=A0A9N8VHT9_9GLOM|nr:17262_t:CDS:2 [Acaulospora morrowiae]
MSLRNISSTFHKSRLGLHQILPTFTNSNPFFNHHFISIRNNTLDHSTDGLFPLHFRFRKNFLRIVFSQSTCWNIVPYRSYVGRAQTTIKDLMKSKISLGPMNSKNAIERIRQKKIKLERKEASQRKRNAPIKKNAASLAQRLKAKLQNDNDVNISTTPDTLLESDIARSSVTTTIDENMMSKTSSGTQRQKIRRTINKFNQMSSADVRFVDKEDNGEKDVKITLESLLEGNLENDSKAINKKSKYGHKSIEKSGTRNVGAGSGTGNIDLNIEHSVKFGKTEATRDKARLISFTLSVNNSNDHNNETLLDSDEQPKSSPTYKEQIRNQQILQRSSKLSKRMFLLELINKRALPRERKQPKDTRIKQIDRENLFTTLESLPKNYDPDWRAKTMPGWLKHKYAIMERTGFGKWDPKKKVPREVMEKIRALHEQAPEENNSKTLSQQFKISPEAVRRILKSKWIPDSMKLERQKRKFEEKFAKIKAERKLNRKESPKTG